MKITVQVSIPGKCNDCDFQEYSDPNRQAVYKCKMFRRTLKTKHVDGNAGGFYVPTKCLECLDACKDAAPAT